MNLRTDSTSSSKLFIEIAWNVQINIEFGPLHSTESFYLRTQEAFFLKQCSQVTFNNLFIETLSTSYKAYIISFATVNEIFPVKYILFYKGLFILYIRVLLIFPVLISYPAFTFGNSHCCNCFTVVRLGFPKSITISPVKNNNNNNHSSLISVPPYYHLSLHVFASFSQNDQSEGINIAKSSVVPISWEGVPKPYH